MSIAITNPVISEDDLSQLGQKYGVLVDPESVPQYQLCQVILMLESKLEETKE